MSAGWAAALLLAGQQVVPGGDPVAAEAYAQEFADGHAPVLIEEPPEACGDGAAGGGRLVSPDGRTVVVASSAEAAAAYLARGYRRVGPPDALAGQGGCVRGKRGR